jgi:hypothetical protein
MNTLDKIIEMIDKSEDIQSDASTDISLLYDVLLRIDGVINKEKREGDKQLQKYREYIFHIESKVKYLLLIIIRLRILVKSPNFRSSGVQTKTIDYFLIDLESFFHYSVSILDVIAKLTPYFYPSQEKNIGQKSFRKLKLWFKRNSDIDHEFVQLLFEKTDWFYELHMHRSNLAHDTSIFFFWKEKPVKLFFGTKRNERNFIPNKNALEYVNSTANYLLEFLIFYNNYFSKRL